MVTATPRLEGWKFREDGSLDGFVFGKAGYRDGEPMTTSEVPGDRRGADHAVTAPCSTYVLGAPRGEYVPPREAAPKRKRAKIDRFVAAPAVNAAARPRAAAREAAAGATFHLVPAKPDWNCFVQRMGGHARNRLRRARPTRRCRSRPTRTLESDEESEQRLFRAALEASRKEYEAAQADEADGADGDSATAEPSAAEPAKPAEAAEPARAVAAEGAVAPPRRRPATRRRRRAGAGGAAAEAAAKGARLGSGCCRAPTTWRWWWRGSSSGSQRRGGRAHVGRSNNCAAVATRRRSDSTPSRSGCRRCPRPLRHAGERDVPVRPQGGRRRARRGRRHRPERRGGAQAQPAVRRRLAAAGAGRGRRGVGVLAARRPRRDQRRDRHQVRVRQGGVHLAPRAGAPRLPQVVARRARRHLTTFGACSTQAPGVCNFNQAAARPDGRLCIFEINTRIGADLAATCRRRSCAPSSRRWTRPRAAARRPWRAPPTRRTTTATTRYRSPSARLDDAAPAAAAARAQEGERVGARLAPRSTAAAPPARLPAAAPPAQALPAAAAAAAGSLRGPADDERAAAEAEASARLAEASPKPPSPPRRSRSRRRSRSWRQRPASTSTRSPSAVGGARSSAEASKANGAAKPKANGAPSRREATAPRRRRTEPRRRSIPPTRRTGVAVDRTSHPPRAVSLASARGRQQSLRLEVSPELGWNWVVEKLDVGSHLLRRFATRYDRRHGRVQERGGSAAAMSGTPCRAHTLSDASAGANLILRTPACSCTSACARRVGARREDARRERRAPPRCPTPSAMAVVERPSRTRRAQLRWIGEEEEVDRPPARWMCLDMEQRAHIHVVPRPNSSPRPHHSRRC